MDSEKLLVSKFYEDFWRYRNDNFVSNRQAAKALHIAPARFTEASHAYVGLGRYPRPQRETLERIVERANGPLKGSAQQLLDFYSGSSGRPAKSFSCWFLGSLLYWAGEEQLLHKGLTTTNEAELELMAASEVLSAFINSQYWNAFSQYITRELAPVFPNELTRPDGHRSLAKKILEQGKRDDIEVYHALYSTMFFSLTPKVFKHPKERAAVLAIQAFIALLASHKAAQVLAWEGRESSVLKRRPLYTFGKEVYKICDQQIPASLRSCEAGIACLSESVPESGTSARQYVDALRDTFESKNPGYFLAVIASLLDSEAAKCWHIKPNSEGDHFLPPRGSRVLGSD